MISGLLLAAGSSHRMGFDKLTTPLGDSTPLLRSLALLVEGGCTEIVAVVSDATRAALSGVDCPVPLTLADGGAMRTDSVRNGLAAATGEIVVIHDAARCFVPVSVVRACIESAERHGSGVAALPMTDTVCSVSETDYRTLDRNVLFRVQTPQAFRRAEILRAYEAVTEPATDDATLYAATIGTPHLVQGSERSRKLTTQEDWEWAMHLSCPKYGMGFDTHRLAEGRRLVLGGVEIPHPLGLLGHSDADVLLHAIMDAILGACGLGDIGRAFPDNDDAYLDIDSRILLRRVRDMVQKRDMSVQHVDATVICQRPKLMPHIPLMQSRIAEDLCIPVSCVSVKATTTEGCNDEGKGICISAQAIASVVPKTDKK